MGVAAAMKRLHFEAEILVNAGLKSMVEQPSSDSASPKQIPFAEKASRMNQLKTTLTGASLEGLNESLALCLRRRGIAYEFANLISYSSHEQYAEKLLRRLSMEAPPNFSQTTDPTTVEGRPASIHLPQCHCQGHQAGSCIGSTIGQRVDECFERL